MTAPPHCSRCCPAAPALEASAAHKLAATLTFAALLYVFARRNR